MQSRAQLLCSSLPFLLLSSHTVASDSRMEWRMCLSLSLWLVGVLNEGHVLFCLLLQLLNE